MAKKKKGNGRGALRLYRSYVFTTKDPEIDILRTVMQDHFGTLNRKAYKDVEEAGGPVAGTLVGWFHGKTRRPQNAALEAAGRAIGWRRKWVRDRDT